MDIINVKKIKMFGLIMHAPANTSNALTIYQKTMDIRNVKKYKRFGLIMHAPTQH